MHFISLTYVAFLVLLFGVYWTLPWVGARVGVPGHRLQNVLLAVTSAVFYGWVHPWFLLLLGFSAVLDYTVGLGLAAARGRGRSGLPWLLASMAGNLGLLGTFKYFNFFVANLTAALSGAGVTVNPWTLEVLLPVGISFYTFQTMSYTIDVYRGRVKPRRDFLDYVVYVSFFPQLVAGPIERAERLLPQVEQPRTLDGDRFLSGMTLALWGGFKKVVIADTLAPYVNEVFMTREPAFALVLAACFAFGVQMLADFSGYTDIARGSARLLGFELVENFDRPYSATNTPEFWRKWHISLSTWVGDYVYTPLLRTGRPSFARMAMATMVTFFLIGLWHGASWNFIVLGLYNGVWMVFYTAVNPLVPRAWGRILPLRFVAWAFHTLVVLTPTGLLFRERDLARVWQHLSQPWFALTREEAVAATVVLGMAFAGTLPINLSWPIEDHVLPRVRASVWRLPLATTTWALLAVAMFIFYRDASGDFIYFEF